MLRSLSSAALDIIDNYFTCEFTTLSRDGSSGYLAGDAEAAQRRQVLAHDQHRVTAEGVQHPAQPQGKHAVLGTDRQRNHASRVPC